MSSFTLATSFINIVFSVNSKGAWGFRKNTAGLMRNIEECFVLDFEQYTSSEGSFYQSVFSVSSAVCTRIEWNGFLCIYSGHTFSPFCCPSGEISLSTCFGYFQRSVSFQFVMRRRAVSTIDFSQGIILVIFQTGVLLGPHCSA